MSQGLLFALAGIALFSTGVAGVILQSHLIRKIIAFNVMSSGTFLVLIGLGQRDGATDPVPHAMVLTGIVVSVAATALALALARRLLNLGGQMRLTADMDEKEKND
ncbi:MAG TPA: NADH-quinone oxidoreductase subunit K [Noviherbaspirillum sp.]|jgi:multicomponent Na+:H+ antiporter subunit C|uniref:NADH-quinone oxidoreductase subunit K n=1 Tax=Noviherbaspirillum sp. TaxID=1926288 RepID=UPI002DDDAAB1|nr:NADH-quinone oxidoreductase subunit K [Noviherbaspirillum sp.]HEV2609473.1 NADH-quinone oxidoreductase subunit K [Noviherbaspirillum sp.]